MPETALPNYQAPDDEDSYSQQEEKSRARANLAGLDSSE